MVCTLVRCRLYIVCVVFILGECLYAIWELQCLDESNRDVHIHDVLLGLILADLELQPASQLQSF